jgi:hypothetical protein
VIDYLKARFSGWAFGFLGGVFLVVWGVEEENLWVWRVGVGEGGVDLVYLVMEVRPCSVLSWFRGCFHW